MNVITNSSTAGVCLVCQIFFERRWWSTCIEADQNPEEGILEGVDLPC